MVEEKDMCGGIEVGRREDGLHAVGDLGGIQFSRKS